MVSGNLPGNPYVDPYVDGHRDVEDEDTAKATLALAYEQRTANLVAYLQLIMMGGGYARDAQRVDAEIAVRLGLEERN